MKVAVLGAGLAGVTAAWELARDGHQVVVLDRAPEVATGASFANGGIIAASRPYAWAGPERVLWQADTLFWLWWLQHLAHRNAASRQRAFDAKRRLVAYSQERLRAIIDETGIRYGRLGNGVLYLYRSQEALERAWQRSGAMRERGGALERLDAAQAAALEPGLDPRAVAGALLARGDEAGDSAQFCRELAQRCRDKGVHFYLECELLGTSVVDQTMTEAITSKGRIRADAYVFALGAYEPKLREHLGTPPPVYPVKGFSTTLGLRDAAAAPRHAGMDDVAGIAWCPMGGRLRVTGGAMLGGYERVHAPEDFEPLHRAIEALFPGAVDTSASQHAHQWACLRPMTPDSTPRLGSGRLANLYFNAGHGHMGWAMAAGSARVIADLVSGRAPGIDLEGLRLRR